MADTKISELPEATYLANSNIIPIVQSESGVLVTKKTSLESFQDLASVAGNTAGYAAGLVSGAIAGANVAGAAGAAAGNTAGALAGNTAGWLAGNTAGAISGNTAGALAGALTGNTAGALAANSLLFSTFNIATGITVSGNVQSNATALTAWTSEIINTPNANNNAVVLSTRVQQIVVNNSNNLLYVFPTVGSQINKLGNNISTSIVAGEAKMFVRSNTTQYFVV